MRAAIDSRTPVLVGVGEASERLGQAGYEARSAADLGGAAARDALADTHADPSDVAGALTVVVGVRQFEISTPSARAPFGRSSNYPRSVATRVGADPARAVLAIAGGQSPQQLVTEFAGRIAAGAEDGVLLVGAEVISTQGSLARAGSRADFTEHPPGSLEDRGFGVEGMSSPEEARHGLAGAAPRYALLENARRAVSGLDTRGYRAAMAELLAPFSREAARHPHAAAPIERGVAELAGPTETNRPIADPYLRYMVARDHVNQGAAVVLTSVGQARRLGIPESRWVYLPGHADLTEPPLLYRPALERSTAAVAAVEHALQLAGTTIDDLGTLDLYSCFPIAVFAVTDPLGLRPDDSRRLTVTGGLPFFGGPGNNYSMHAIAETVRRMRACPGEIGLVGANGGFLSKYSVGVYSTRPSPWRPDRSAELQAGLDVRRGPPPAEDADGVATVETYTVVHDRDGQLPIVVGRLVADGRRFLARGNRSDEQLLDQLTGPHPFGSTVRVRPSESGNHITSN